MVKSDEITAESRVPTFLATRFSRGRLGLWITFSTIVVLLNHDILRLMPRWVFSIWAGWVAMAALVVIALEYVLPPFRRHWLDATQACLDIGVIALITWHLGATLYLLAALLAITTSSASGWLTRRHAIAVAVCSEVTMLVVMCLVAAGVEMPTPLGTAGTAQPAHAFVLMVLGVQTAVLTIISWFQYSAVRVARDRRQRWQRLFDGAPDSIFVLDRNGVVVRMNSAARRLAGGASARARTGEPGLYIAPEDRDQAALQFNRAIAGNQSSYEARSVRADGTLAHVLVSNAPMVEDGTITGVLSIVHDMTDMRRAEEERRRIEQSLDQHRRLLQSIVSTVPTYLYVLDLRLRHVTFANDALLQVIGRSLEQLAHLPRDEMFMLYHPDDVVRLQTATRRLRDSGDAKATLEYRIRGADGQWRWLSDRVTVFERDADGSVTRLLGSAIDITEQKRVSAQLQASDELYRTLIENYPGGAVMMFDHDARLLLAEGRGLRESGIEGGRLIGRTVADLLEPQTAAMVERHCRDALAGNEQQFEVRLGDRIFDVRAVPVRDADGAIRFGMALTLDVTERRRLEADTRQAQKMEAVGTLAGGIAHDFNNILASVIGYAELAMLDAESDELQSDLHQVLTAAARGRQMVHRILAFSRRSGEELHAVEVSPIVSETLRLLRPTLPAGVTIDFNPENTVPAVLGDAGQLHQVILNLCGNALYAMRDTGGTLSVRLQRILVLGQSYLQIEVSDTGTGMTSEVLDRAVDPFFTTKPPEEGTGMGLAMVHGIVSSLGGVFRLESTLGRGTTAVIELPADVERPRPAAQADSVDATPTGSERVMIVDDEPSVALFHANALKRFGYRTTTFTNASAALTSLRNPAEHYDLIFTDMTMPHLSGEELLRESLLLRPGTPVIICTGFSASMTPERAAELGAAGYLTKPLSVHELATHVRRILDQTALASREG